MENRFWIVFIAMIWMLTFPACSIVKGMFEKNLQKNKSGEFNLSTEKSRYYDSAVTSLRNRSFYRVNFFPPNPNVNYKELDYDQLLNDLYSRVSSLETDIVQEMDSLHVSKDTLSNQITTKKDTTAIRRDSKGTLDADSTMKANIPWYAWIIGALLIFAIVWYSWKKIKPL